MKNKFNILSILFKSLIFFCCLFVLLGRIDFSLKELSLLCCISLITDFMIYINMSVSKNKDEKESVIHGESELN